jgi:hypothetical protein
MVASTALKGPEFKFKDKADGSGKFLATLVVPSALFIVILVA